MTQALANATIAAHNEELIHGNYVGWPQTVLTVTAGDWILGYRGPGPLDGVCGIGLTNGGSGYGAPPTVTLTGGGGAGATAAAIVVGGVVTMIQITNPGSGYTTPPAVVLTPVSGGSGAAALCTLGVGIVSTDGSDVLCFGAYWNGVYNAGGTFTGAASGQFVVNGSQQYFSGPYCSVPANSVNLKDEMFQDVEIVSPLDYLLDPQTGEYPHGGAQNPLAVFNGNIVNGAVGRTKLSQAHPTRGAFVNGRLRILSPNPDVVWQVDDTPNAGVIMFMSDGTDGDAGTPGFYRIVDEWLLNPNLATGRFRPAITPEVIVPRGNPGAAQMLAAGPANGQIAFCRYAPGSGGGQTQINGGGSLPPATSWWVRFCLYRNSITRNGYAQNVESFLSPVMNITTASDGLSNHRVQFVLPTLPKDATAKWDGFRVYMSNALNGQYFLQGTVNVGQGVSGGTVTIPSYNNFSNSASYGFTIWPSSTDFTEYDGTPEGHFFNAFMLLVANIPYQADAVSGEWLPAMTNGRGAIGPQDLPIGGVRSPHLLVGQVMTATAPGTNPDSGSIAGSGTPGAWRVSAGITSVWTLPNVDTYNAIRASGNNIKVQFKDVASGNVSAWSGAIATGPLVGVWPPGSLSGCPLLSCDAGYGGGAGIVTDISINFNAGSPQLTVVWQGVNMDNATARTVQIFVKAEGIWHS